MSVHRTIGPLVWGVGWGGGGGGGGGFDDVIVSDRFRSENFLNPEQSDLGLHCLPRPIFPKT